MANINVSFRHVGLRTEEGEISGICLSYPDEESARAAFAVFHEYITSPSGKKSMRVEFSRESAELYSLQVVLAMPERTFETQISGIDSSYVDRIKESLTKFTYYAILAGYEEHGEFCLLPILEIADSKLKKVEAIHVGEAIARAVESDLLELGLSLCSCCLGVLGFGDIGASVAASLRRRRGVVSCYDPNPLKTIEAKMLGFACPVKERILTESVLIVGATGVRSLTCDELPILRDGVVLVSASSRDLEFPIRQITEISKISSCLTEFVSEFIMPWGKRIRIVNCGCPVNFRGHSLPISVSDLIFCQIAACIVKLITQRLPPGIHRISIDDEKQIASLWLETYG